MDILIMAGQLMLSLSILIVLHEFGHFLPARWFKTRVEKFYLFFDPYFHIFEKKIGETRYGLGWLPLGGYVKISGMVDESMDTEALKAPPQPWEFRSKKAWQRLIIMIGGVTVNFILGIIILAGILMYWGEEYLPASAAKYGIYADSLGQQIGLRTGDKILKVGTQTAQELNVSDMGLSVKKEIVFNDAKTIEVERDGTPLSITLPADAVTLLSARSNQDRLLLMPRMPFFIDEIPSESPNKNANMKKGDQVIGLNNNKIEYFDQFSPIAQTLKNQSVALTLLRGKDTIRTEVKLNENGQMLVRPNRNLNDFFEITKKKYGFVGAFAAGNRRAWAFIGAQLNAFGKMFSGKVSAKESLGGFGTIAKSFGTDWNWLRFWNMTATLSILLAFMNLLPIPALDGGHVMFLLYEVVTGRKPSDVFMERATMVGFFLIIGLVLYANGLDILRGCNF